MKDKLFINANIFGHETTTDAILVKDDSIAAAGTIGDCRRISSTDVELIDCRGSLIIPGFIDSHTHLVETGEALLNPDLGGKNVDDLLVYLKNQAAADNSGRPIIVMGLSDRQFTSLKDCSIIPADGGMLIFHSSGHCAIADRNAAVRLHRKVGRSGQLIIDEPYEDPAILMILQNRKKEPQYLGRCVQAGIDAYHASGVTSLQDNTWDPDVFKYYQDEVGNMDIDCWSKGLLELTNHYTNTAGGSRTNIKPGPAKFFLDGAFFNRTAWLSEPYAGETDWYGSGMSSDQIIEKIEPAIAAKRQCAFHAAGDRTISELCDALEILAGIYPWVPELRIRVEHAQLINDYDYDRIRSLGLVISAQPQACTNPERDIKFLGEKRAARAYPHKRIISEGIPLSFGSDFPYEADFNPLRGINHLCSRSIGVSLDLEEAVKAHTEGSAFAGFSENRKGRIAAGYQADFLIIPEAADSAGRLESIHPGSVYYRGDMVYNSTKSYYLTA